MTKTTETAPLYDEIAAWFDSVRRRDLSMERPYLEKLLALAPENPAVLDLGCGSGAPVAQFFLENNCRVTGVDLSRDMLNIARQRFPDATWIHGDMRGLDLGRRFNILLAWDSFFHLTRDAQHAMFPVFAAHANPAALLMFNTGGDDGETWGEMQGRDFHHASLARQDYEALLAENGFTVFVHKADDPACGGRTVWIAAYSAGRAMR